MVPRNSRGAHRRLGRGGGGGHGGVVAVAVVVVAVVVVTGTRSRAAIERLLAPVSSSSGRYDSNGMCAFDRGGGSMQGMLNVALACQQFSTAQKKRLGTEKISAVVNAAASARRMAQRSLLPSTCTSRERVMSDQRCYSLRRRYYY